MMILGTKPAHNPFMPSSLAALTAEPPGMRGRRSRVRGDEREAEGREWGKRTVRRSEGEER